MISPIYFNNILLTFTLGKNNLKTQLRHRKKNNPKRNNLPKIIPHENENVIRTLPVGT